MMRSRGYRSLPAAYAEPCGSAKEAVRAIPHLAMDTLRRGNRRARLRLFGTIATLALGAASRFDMNGSAVMTSPSPRMARSPAANAATPSFEHRSPISNL